MHWEDRDSWIVTSKPGRVKKTSLQSAGTASPSAPAPYRIPARSFPVGTLNCGAIAALRDVIHLLR